MQARGGRQTDRHGRLNIHTHDSQAVLQQHTADKNCLDIKVDSQSFTVGPSHQNGRLDVKEVKEFDVSLLSNVWITMTSPSFMAPAEQ